MAPKPPVRQGGGVVTVERSRGKAVVEAPARRTTLAAAPAKRPVPAVVEPAASAAPTSAPSNEGAKAEVARKAKGPTTAGSWAQKRWRDRHPEEWKRRNAEYQRKWRARKKAEKGDA